MKRCSITLFALLILGCGVKAPAERQRTSVLELRLVVESTLPDTEELVFVDITTKTGQIVPEVLHVKKGALLDQRAVRSAAVCKYRYVSGFVVEITFTDEGRGLFEAITRQNIGKRLAIVLDGKGLTAPKVKAAITGGKVTILPFSEEAAKEVARKINDAAAK